MDRTASRAISGRRLEAFADLTVLRDRSGRGLRPGLRMAGGAVEVDGAFEVRRRLVPTRARGVRFAEATGDPNPIHRDGDVVPGAFLAAQVVGTFEALLPDLRPESLRISFTGVTFYERPLRLRLRAEPAPPGAPAGLRVVADAWQDDRRVADAVLEGSWARAERVALPLERVDTAWLGRVVESFDALGIDPRSWLEKDAGPDLSYPLSFLVALPSGTMVRRLEGDGGLLNRLTLELHHTKLPLAGPPEVDVELPSRIRQSFTRILTLVKEGVQTAIRGTALVLPRPAIDVVEAQRLGLARR